MGFEDYVSESEAATISGVSASTLRRFAEAGYLHIEADADGLQLFSKSELTQLFGLKDFEEVESSLEPTDDLDAVVDLPPEDDGPPIATAELARQIRVENSEISSPKTNAAPKRNGIFQTMENELHKLKTVSSLQEKLLEMREQEIKDLKEQREWLKTRLEKLEEKGERDQILLLAETQTIRKLVTLQEQKKSAFQLCLDWLGFTPSQNSQKVTTDAIELSKEK